MPKNTSLTPKWVENKTINEVLFCQEFLQSHPMVSVGGAFFTKDGLMPDENILKSRSTTASRTTSPPDLAKR